MRAPALLRLLGTAAAAAVAFACSGLVDPADPDAPGSGAVRGLRLDAAALALAVGETRQVSATLLNAQGQPVTPPAGQAVRFRSTDATIATVTDAGLVTAVAVGAAVVRAEFGALVVGVPVTVIASGTDRLELVSGTAQTGPPGAQLGEPLVVRALAANGQPRAGLTVTFAPAAGTAAPATATTDAQGLASTRWTLGAATGAQSLVASAPGFGSVTFTATAVARPVATIQVTPATPSLGDVGQTVQLTARALDNTGAEVPGVTFTWASSRPDVAIVNGTGLVTAVAAGQSTISASAGTVSGSTVVTVTLPVAPPRLLLTPTSLSGSATQTATSAPRVLGTVEVREATGRPLTDLGTLGVGTVTYGAGQPAGWVTSAVLGGAGGATLTVTVDPAGLPAGTYTATVPVTSALASNSPIVLPVQLTVTAPAVPVIAVSPARWDPSLAFGATTPATQAFAITNGAGGTLGGLAPSVSYGAGQATGWLTPSLSGTTAPATLTLSASAGALAAGTYDATVTVTSTVSGVAPVAIPVRLTVTGGGRLRVFQEGAELSGFIRNDTLVLGTASQYGTQAFQFDLALADAGGQRLRPGALSAPSFPTGAPAESWLTPVASDTGVSFRISHTPALLAGRYAGTVTVSAAGFTPLVVRYDFSLQTRLVALLDPADTTSVITAIEYPLDENRSGSYLPAPQLRQLGGWCQRGGYDVLDPRAEPGPFPRWLGLATPPSPAQRVSPAVFAIDAGAITPGTEERSTILFRQALPLSTPVGDALCPAPAGDAAVELAARAPGFTFATDVDTLSLTLDPDDARLLSGRFDLNVVPRPPFGGSCTEFDISVTAVQVLLDPADAADGLDNARIGDSLGTGTAESLRPDGATIFVALDTTGLRGGRTYTYGLAYSAAFRCGDGVIPVPDTAWVRFSTGGGGTTGTLTVRGRGGVGLPSDERPFQAYISSVNPGSEAIGPFGYPTYNVSVYYVGGPVPAGDDITVSDITYSAGGTAWLDVSAFATNIGDTVAFFGVQLSRSRPPLPRGNYRATVTLRSSASGQTVSFPVTHVVGGQDGRLEFTQVTTGANSGCGIAGDPTAPASGDQLFCWGQIGAGLVPDGEPAGYWHERAGNVAQFPVPMSDSVLGLFSNGVTRPRIRQVATASLNLVLLVESSVDGRTYVLASGNLGSTQSTDPIEDFRGMRPVRSSGSPGAALVTARAVSVGLTGTRACAISEAGQPFCWGQADPAIPLAVTGTLQQFSTPEPMDSVVLGGGHACAWAVGGNAYCWGNNVDGQLGRGTIGGTGLPVQQVPGLTDVRSMSAASFTTCARTGSGIFCWGSNQSGIIYGRTLGTRFGSPQAVTPPVTDFQFRQSHACGRSSTTPGALFCWGVEFVPGGAVSGPTGTRPVTFGYREVLWPVTITQYHVGDATTCYASSRVWSCSGGVAQFVGTGGGNVSVTTPQVILGQQPRLIVQAGFRATGPATAATRGGDGLLSSAGQWVRGLLRRERPAARPAVTPRAPARGAAATRRTPLIAGPRVTVARPHRALPAPPPARPRYVRVPLEELLRRPAREAPRLLLPGAPPGAPPAPARAATPPAQGGWRSLFRSRSP